MAKYFFFPILLEEPPKKFVKRLEMVFPCYIAPNTMRLTVGAAFDEFTVNGGRFFPDLKRARETMPRHMKCQACKYREKGAWFDSYTWSFDGDSSFGYRHFADRYPRELVKEVAEVNPKRVLPYFDNFPGIPMHYFYGCTHPRRRKCPETRLDRFNRRVWHDLR